MIVVEWKLTTVLRQEPWSDAPPRKSGVACRSALRAEPGDPTRRPHTCVLARPTTDPDAKTWSIPTYEHWPRVFSVTVWDSLAHKIYLLWQEESLAGCVHVLISTYRWYPWRLTDQSNICLKQMEHKDYIISFDCLCFEVNNRSTKVIIHRWYGPNNCTWCTQIIMAAQSILIWYIKHSNSHLLDCIKNLQVQAC